MAAKRTATTNRARRALNFIFFRKSLRTQIYSPRGGKRWLRFTYAPVSCQSFFSAALCVPLRLKALSTQRPQRYAESAEKMLINSKADINDRGDVLFE